MALGPPEASRRALVTSVGIAGVGVALSAAPAAAKPGKTHQYHGQQLLKRREKHLVSRFSYGITPALATQVRAAGGGRAWWERQLTPAAIADPFGDQLSSWWPSLSQTPQDMWAQDKTGMMRAFGVCQDYQRYVLLRRIYSNRQVLELMTEFWENHLNIPLNGEPSYLFRRAYGETLRANAFGRYEDILFNAVTHPAMLVYLDNSNSTAEHPNENLGRELLELHTVGIGNYTEDHVKDSARILTGWRVDTQQGNKAPTWVPSYIPGDHAVGPVRVMDFADPNGDPDGRDLTRRYIGYLAHHPLTARRIATKLVLKFVRDDVSAALVDRLAQVYLQNDTAIVPVLRALIDSRGVQRLARRQGPRRHGGRGRHLARPRRPGPPAHQPSVRGQHAALAGRQPGPDAVHVAATRRRTAGQRSVVQPVPDDRQLRHAPLDVRWLVAERGPGDGLPGPEDLGARAAHPPRRAHRPPEPAAAPPARDPRPHEGLLPCGRLPPRREDHPPAPRAVLRDPTVAEHGPRLPRLLPQVTP